MTNEELLTKIELLTRQIEEIKRSIGQHNHPYSLHAREHEGRDTSPFLRVPIYSGRPSYIPNGRLYYRSDTNKLEIQVNGTIMSSGVFT